ncbi:serine protease HTRA3a isoform X2 [Antennarius striatus]|uniref:serine protease HTRA3a isoform X2 n=1 Tax=Antennarius striatus TaxID=241820 RepID=UPI0035ADD35C
MHFLLIAAALLFTHDFPGAAHSQKCPSKCDLSSCPSPSCPSGYVLDKCNCCLVCSPREGDPCARKGDLPCGDGLECRMLAAGSRRGSRGICRCRVEDEVCGNDGRTYGNVCRLTAASRKAQQQGKPAISQAHGGSCAPSDAGQPHPGSPRQKFNFIADVVEKIAPAVVHIELSVRHPLFGRHMRLSSGSGFIVTHSGLIVTNAHVVTAVTTVPGRPQLRVQLHDGDAYEAVVRDVDRKADIATIKVKFNPQKKLPVLSLGRSADLRPGEFVVAIGSPFALQNTVTTGIVSTAQRDGKELGIKDSDIDYIQTDAIINYGNSGGPLVNLDGEVIGINTLKVTAGISFAIPADRVTRFLAESQTKHSKEKTRLHGRPPEEHQSDAGSSGEKKLFLGIRMLAVTKVLVAELKRQIPDFPEVSGGVLVQQVIPDTPAQKGGIKNGDVILKINGRPVRSAEDVRQALQRDQPLLLEIRRGENDLLFSIQPRVIAH